jgi:nitrate/TMAO reductase-like tetraheme cytochrome c subunit
LKKRTYIVKPESMGLSLALAILLLLTTLASAQEDVQCYHCHDEQVKEFQKNVHREHGMTCTDCHGGLKFANASVISREAMSGTFRGAPTRAETAEFCSKCHEKEAADFEESEHWKELQKGHKEAATCTDCHGTHNILPIDDPESPTNHENIAITCAKCHADPNITSIWYYGIKSDRFDTYKESYHWKALERGYKVVASCPDCHENHATKPAEDPTSSINPNNLAKTCEKTGCHEGASLNAKVALGLVHDRESYHTARLVFNKSTIPEKERGYYLGPFDLMYWIGLFFNILTKSVIAILLAMVALDLISRFEIRLKKR